MVFSNPGPLLAPYEVDRAAASVIESYSVNTLAPHSATTRWTYTPPANRLAIAQSAWVQLACLTAPSVAGELEAFLQIFVDPDWEDVVRPAVWSAAIGDGFHVTIPTSAVVQDVNQLRSRTEIGGTGGDYAARAQAALMEFDV